MENKVNLTARGIYDKRFTVVSQGYDAEEVDSVLDLVIEDYQFFETANTDVVQLQEKVAYLTQRNEELIAQNDNITRQNKLTTEQKIVAENRVAEVLRQSEEMRETDVAKIEGMNAEIATAKERIKELEEKLAEQITPQNFNQLEVLKRIARIEQKVFGKD